MTAPVAGAPSGSPASNDALEPPAELPAPELVAPDPESCVGPPELWPTLAEPDDELAAELLLDDWEGPAWLARGDPHALDSAIQGTIASPVLMFERSEAPSVCANRTGRS